MRKYRIVEFDGGFYPQEKKFYFWVFIDNLSPKYVWGSDKDYQSRCISLDDAKLVIEKRIKFLNSQKIIIHPYP